VSRVIRFGKYDMAEELLDAGALLEDIDNVLLHRIYISEFNMIFVRSEQPLFTMLFGATIYPW
jgi:hypothetical protein